MDEQHRDVITTAQAASLLGVSAARVSQMVDEKKLPAPLKLGARVHVFRRADVEAVAARVQYDERVTGISALLAPAAHPLARRHDLVLDVATWGAVARCHVRVFAGTAEEGERLVVILGSLTHELIALPQHMGTIAELVDEQLLEGRGGTASWYSYRPGWTGSSYDKHEFENVILRVPKETASQPRSLFRRRAIAEPSAKFMHPTWSTCTVEEVERVIGQQLECYPTETYEPEVIERWQRARTTVEVEHDEHGFRPLLAALAVLEVVPADHPRYSAALAACAVVADQLRNRVEWTRERVQSADRNDGTKPPSGRQSAAWPTLFAARLVPLPLGPLDRARIERYAGSSDPKAADSDRRQDLLLQLRRWELEAGPYGENHTALHTAVATAADVVVHLLRLECPDFDEGRFVLHQPRLFEVVEECDRRYLAQVRFAKRVVMQPVHRALLHKVWSDSREGVTFGRDPWNRVVAHVAATARMPEDFVVDWPGQPPNEIPAGSHLVADGAPGDRPVYIEHPNGALDLLPLDGDRTSQWNFGYGGGGPGALVHAICRAFQIAEGVARESLPYGWLDDQVCHSPEDSLRISVDELRRRIGPQTHVW